MRVLVTGSTGYIGQQVALVAAGKGYQVHALLRDCNSLLRPVHPNIHYFKGDLTDPKSITAAAQGCEAVLHAAALAQLWNKDRKLFYKVNVEGTKNMLEAARDQGVKKFVFTSTCGVLGPSYTEPVCEDDPRRTAFENDYEISKYCAEEVVREYARSGLFSVIVCPPRVYGPGLQTGGNAMQGLLKKLLTARLTFVPAAGHVLGNYAYVEDVVAGHFKALEHGTSGEKYILGGENVSYTRFFQTIIQATGQPTKMIRLPKGLMKAWSALAFGACYAVGKHTNISPKVIDRLFQNRALSCEKAVQQIGYTITPFEQGIAKTIHHLKHQNP
jgi:nucleoside-diphosphate-sugar epimerase